MVAVVLTNAGGGTLVPGQPSQLTLSLVRLGDGGGPTRISSSAVHLSQSEVKHFVDAGGRA